jgi:molybdopterin/thiamine biosynthesis adenylyltransferase
MRRFIVIGAGGVGSHLAEPLIRMLEWSSEEQHAVIFVDGDYYEPKNKKRQTFSKLGNKAEVLAADMQPKFEKTMVAPLPRWVVSEVGEEEVDPDDVDEEGNPNAPKIAASDLIQEGDVIYAVVDNFSARKIIFDAAAKMTSIDVFAAGNDEDLFGSVYHYRIRDGVEVTRNPNDFKPEYVDPADRNPGDLSCQERAEIDGGTQLIAVNFAVAGLLLGRTQATIIEDGDPHECLEQSDIFFDLRVGLMSSYDRRTVKVDDKETATV